MNVTATKIENRNSCLKKIKTARRNYTTAGLGKDAVDLVKRTLVSNRKLVVHVIKGAVRRLLKSADYLTSHNGQVPPGFKDWKQFLLAALLPGTNGKVTLIKAVVISLTLNRLWRALANRLTQIDSRIDLLGWTFAIRKYYGREAQWSSGLYSEEPIFDWSTYSSSTGKITSNDIDDDCLDHLAFKPVNKGILYNTSVCAAHVITEPLDLQQNLGTSVLRVVPCWSIINDHTMTAHDHRMIKQLKLLADSVDRELLIRKQDLVLGSNLNGLEAQIVSALEGHGFTVRADGSLHRFQVHRQTVNQCLATSLAQITSPVSMQPIRILESSDYNQMFNSQLESEGNRHTANNNLGYSVAKVRKQIVESITVTV